MQICVLNIMVYFGREKKASTFQMIYWISTFKISPIQIHFKYLILREIQIEEEVEEGSWNERKRFDILLG